MVSGPAPFDRTYGYDQIGNLTYDSSIGTLTYGENTAGPHAVTSTTAGDTYSYDTDGAVVWRSLAGSPAQHFVYNALGRVRYEANWPEYEFNDYQADGTRIAKATRDAKIVTIEGLFERRIDKATGQVTDTSYYDGPDGALAAMSIDGSIVYAYTNQLGTVAATWNTVTGAINHQYYLPYGEIRASDGLDTTLGYTGQRHDPSGLIYYQARYYDPHVGRFTQPDTIVPNPSNPADFNRYTYVRNNPVNLIDPDGRCPTDSAAATACYAAYAAQQPGVSSNDRLISQLWAAWGRISVATQHFVGSFATQPDTVGYSTFYASADPDYTAKQTQDLAEAAFVSQVGADLAGLHAGNGVFLLPESTFEGPSRERPPGEIRGNSGWRAGLVDGDNSPARHLLGWLLFGYVYPESQVEAGLRVAESAGVNGASQQDYDLGVIGYQAGSRLTALDYTVPDPINHLHALTSDSSQAQFSAQPAPPNGVPGSGPLCYFGVTC